MSWNVDLGVKNQIYNWYGLPTETIFFDDPTIAGIDSTGLADSRRTIEAKRIGLYIPPFRILRQDIPECVPLLSPCRSGPG